MPQDNAFSLISPELLKKLNAQNITIPTKVQETVIPQILAGENIVFQSETGTGKTLAYLLPLLTKLFSDFSNVSEQKSVRILIVAPTFELASQIKQTLSSVADVKSALFIGGSPIKRQIEALKEKPAVVIGTPVRLVELIHLKKLKIQDVFASVFDEADRLVKKELTEETSSLKKMLPANTQIIACTATADKKTGKFFSEAKTVIMPEEDILTKKIEHWALFAEARDKIETLRKFLLAVNPEKALVFTSRADQVENIFAKLNYKKIDCAALHAKSDNQARKTCIDRFKSGKCKLLITSDLAARGLDIPYISHIIQMDFPADTDFFIHRAGRTARAGKSGVNIVIGDEYELRQYAALEKKLGFTVYPKIVINGKISAPSYKN
ncbi:MAG: DEAD/DEAH box helicase [Treponema sp.]